MKYWMTSAILAVAAVLMGADTATYISHDKIADALAKGGSLAASKEYTVSGAHRTAAGQVEMHEKETDILYVMDGEATFITGGTMVGGKMSKAGQWLGSAGMPHWFKEVPKSVSYFVVKVLKE